MYDKTLDDKISSGRGNVKLFENRVDYGSGTISKLINEFFRETVDQTGSVIDYVCQNTGNSHEIRS